MKIQPKNWTKFQHYKQRRPPWIRLYHDILDDYEFHCLPVASKALATLLWLLASEYEDGIIDAPTPKIAFRLRMTEKEFNDSVAPLVSSGFFITYEDASNPLAPCEHDATPETETETETETDPPLTPQRMTLKEFCEHYRQSYRVFNMPGGCVPKAEQLMDRYPRDRLIEAFAMAADNNATQFNYLVKILENPRSAADDYDPEALAREIEEEIANGTLGRNQFS